MTIGSEIAFQSASELRDLIRDKQVSPVELVRLYFERIDSLNPQLNAYLTLARDEAEATAQDAEDAVMRGDDLGPLHGVPIGVKDLESTAGIRTTGGSLVFKDRVPTADSVVVERVRASGAIILGKTNTPELGLLGSTESRLGDCRNPWDTSRSTGGSSGGAGAALTAGLCALATGGDGGGSIRIPASFCGVYGIKPTQGRVPKFGGVAGPPMANQFSQQGPMSRTVKDSAVLLQVVAGHDPRDPGSLREAPEDYVAATERGVEGLRVGWSVDLGYAPAEAEVASMSATAAGVFEELGCTVEDADFAIESPFDTFWALFTANLYAGYGDLLRDHPDEITWYTRRCLENGATVTGGQYSSELGRMDELKSRFATLFETYDLVLTPTMPTTAFPLGEPPAQIDGRDAYREIAVPALTYPINMIGHPAASIPCGIASDGLPVGLHVIGRPGDEATILAASAAFERARPWDDRRPPVS